MPVCEDKKLYEKQKAEKEQCKTTEQIIADQQMLFEHIGDLKGWWGPDGTN